MSKVSTIDRKTLQKVIRPALDAKLAELSEELGIKVTATRGTYGDTTGSFKIELATINENGVINTPEREAFEMLHKLYDLPKEALDAVIESGGTKMRIAGINSKAPKNNVVLECIDGSGSHRVAPASTVLAIYNQQHGGQRKAS